MMDPMILLRNFKTINDPRIKLFSKENSGLLIIKLWVNKM